MFGVRPVPLAVTCKVTGVLPLAGVTESQLPVDVAEAFTAIAPGVPEMVRLPAAGAGPPCTCVKASDVGAVEIVPGRTTRVTGTVMRLLAVFGVVEVMLTVPLYVLGARPAALTLIETCPGVVPLVGVALSQ